MSIDYSGPTNAFFNAYLASAVLIGLVASSRKSAFILCFAVGVSIFSILLSYGANIELLGLHVAFAFAGFAMVARIAKERWLKWRRSRL
jgi:hypothetical protein